MHESKLGMLGTNDQFVGRESGETYSSEHLLYSHLSNTEEAEQICFHHDNDPKQTSVVKEYLDKKTHSGTL